MKPIEQVQKEHEPAWLKLPHVIGVGIGEVDGRSGLLVFVSEREGSHAKIPAQVEGYAVKVVVTGTVRPVGQSLPP